MCGGEGAERAAGAGELDLPSSDVGPEPRRTEPSRSANFAAAKFRKDGGKDTGTLRYVREIMMLQKCVAIPHMSMRGSQ